MGAAKPASYSELYGLEKSPAKAAPEDDDQGDAPDELPAESGDDERDDQGHDSPDDPHADTDDDAGDAVDSGDSGGGDRQSVSIPGGKLAGAGAGWVLGVLLWGWVVLPFVKGGPVAVGKTLRAKFLNQAPDGSQLP